MDFISKLSQIIYQMWVVSHNDASIGNYPNVEGDFIYTTVSCSIVFITILVFYIGIYLIRKLLTNASKVNGTDF